MVRGMRDTLGGDADLQVWSCGGGQGRYSGVNCGDGIK